MTPPPAVILADGVEIPRDALESLEGFRRWSSSADFPSSGRIDYLAGTVEVDMSPEELHTHGNLKACVGGALYQIVSAAGLGDVFIDRARVSSPDVGLSAEPDVVVVLDASRECGRVRYVPSGHDADRYLEIEGAPDLVVEVVSQSSVGKDTERLPPLLLAAGCRELWIVDARLDAIRFDVRASHDGAWVPLAPDAEGFVTSRLLGRRVKLRRWRTALGTWRYALDHEPTP